MKIMIRRMPSWKLCILSLSIFAVAMPIIFPTDAAEDSESVEIIRDIWGTPHIFANSSEGAFFGLGYATAQDRMFQMEYSRRIVKGTISEIVGEKGLQSDKQWRTIGWYRNAQETAKNIDESTKLLLQAYSDGINHYLQENGDLLYLFQEYGINPEPWTPADSIACWYRISYFFNGLDNSEADNLHNFESLIEQLGFEEATHQLLPDLKIDESGAIVQETDMNPSLIMEIETYLGNHGYNNTVAPKILAQEDSPKASHNWVISGNRTTTGTAILHSDPQITIFAPSLWYEFHISGGEFDARGIGLAGAPAMIIGWNRNIAWGATAAKADVVDQYRLEINPENPNEYSYDGIYRPMEIREEEINLPNGTLIPMTVRNTLLGPVVTSLNPNSGFDEFAMQHAEVYRSNSCSLTSLMLLMKAKSYEDFNAAIANYMSPSLHMIYGDKNGNIAYQLLAGISLRSAEFPFFGAVAQPGNSSIYLWQDIIPKKYLPNTFNPPNGAISTANNLAAGTWYPIPTSFGTGDTIRSWRLRERLSMQDIFTPEDVLAIHQDTVNPAVREIVRLSRYINANTSLTLTTQAQRALTALQDWNGQFNSSQSAYPLISNFNLMFRASNTPLATIYGGGEGGLCNFAKKIKQDLDTNIQYVPTEDEKNYVDTLLKNAWTKTTTELGSDQSQWLQNYDHKIYIKFENNLENFGSLDPGADMTSQPLMCKHTATVLSQHGNSYSQNVRFDNIDLSLSILPPGTSEKPTSPLFNNQMPIWTEGSLHAAPLTRQIAQEDATNTMKLVFPPTAIPTQAPSPTPMPKHTAKPTGTPITTPTPITTYSPSYTSTPQPKSTPTTSALSITSETSYLIVGASAATAIAVIFLILKRRK